MRIPVKIWKTDLIHVGQMRGKPWPSDSQEGLLLSCSNCPDDWSRIARLGAGVEWTVRKNGLIKLLHIHKLNRKTRKDWMTASETAGLVIPTVQYKVISTDEEGEELYSIYASKAAAAAECNEGDKPLKIKGWKASEKLAHFWNGKKRIDPIFVETAALVYLAFKNHPIDGIWWNDVYDPVSLSAPRIGIHPSKIKNINRKTQEIILK